MRREHHPYWIERAADLINSTYSRHFLYPQFDALGPDARFAGVRYVKLQGPCIRAGRDLHVFAASHAPVSLCVNPYEGGDGHINIGDFCVLSPGAQLRSAIGIDIGDNCMLAEGAFITDADWHDTYHRIFPGKCAAVRLENNVWLGNAVTVCKGVTIGENSIIGAASVVTRDIPANTIAAGNPAKPIGQLDPNAPHSTRKDLFIAPRPYAEFKAEHDQARLQGNTLAGYLRALLFPTSRS